MVLSGSYGIKCMPTGIGEAERMQWAGRDVTLWCSKLGDYTLTAPLHLVLLQCPNCYAIFFFSLHSGQTPLVMSLGYIIRLHNVSINRRGLALEWGHQGCSLAESWMMSHMWHMWFIHISKRRCICRWERTQVLSLKELSRWTSAVEIYTSLTCHQLILIKG